MACSFSVLSKLETDAFKQFIQFCAQIVIAYLILTSLRSEQSLQISIMNFTASIPVSYFLVASSYGLLILAISLCHLSVAISLKASESGKILLSGFSTSVYGLLGETKNDLSLGLGLFSSFFLKEVVPTSAFLGYGTLLGLIALLLPIGAFGCFLIAEQFAILIDQEYLIVERISVLAGIVLSIFGFLYAFLFHLPLPVRKNTSHIRWNFLSRLSGDTLHPQIKRWLDENC